MALDPRRQISRLFSDAMARAPEARAAFLDGVCDGDDALRREIEALLQTATNAAPFLSHSPAAIAAPAAGGAGPNPIALQPDVILGKYRIQRQLGRGGMGTVFLAHDETLRRPTAIKVLQSTGDTTGVPRRVLWEARSASALNHPHICTVYEVGEAAGHAYIAMEYVDGRPLPELIAGRALPLDDAVRYAVQGADALAHAHDRGVLHCDFKAANALVSSNGRIKIVDFGLARRTEMASDETTAASIAGIGTAAGTPYAMAPEQIRGLTMDARTDLWALGVLLHEMLSGTRPFTGATIAELFSAILRDPPAALPPDTPDTLREIVQKCLTKDRDARYQRAADVRLLLESVASSLQRREPVPEISLPLGAPLPAHPLFSSTARESEFVGRLLELQEMQQAWTRAATGQRQVVLLGGEPGIGKTRLSVEFARREVGRGATVLMGRCDEDTLLPYQPFAEALGWYVRVCPERELRAQLNTIGGGGELGRMIPELLRRVPDLPTQPTMSAEGQRYRLFEAVSDFLAEASAARPLILVIDDLHWADKTTSLMLRHLMRASRPARLCIVATYREHELPRSHPLLADAGRQTAVRVSVGSLDRADISALITTVVGRQAPTHLVKLVAENTEGNPFFAGEMARHLTETGALDAGAASHGTSVPALSLPEGVKATIRQRLSRLSKDCQRALELAAVIGREFSIDLLEAAGDLSENQLLDAIDEGARAQLIVERTDRPGRFAFVHALIRETLYGDMTQLRRGRLHRRAGEAIERLSPGLANPPLADLALHFVHAASAATADKAIDYATRAGDRAADALAHEEAARLYAMALTSLELKEPDRDAAARRVDLHAARARAFGELGQWSLQKPEIEQALQHLEPQMIERRCELILELASALVWLNSLHEGRQLCREALELAERLERSDLAANAMGWLGVQQQLDGDLLGASDTHRRAIARGATAAAASFSFGPQVLYLAGKTPEALELAQQAAEMSRSSHDSTFIIWTRTHLGLALSSAGRYVEAHEAFEDARAFGRKYGVLPFLARATSMSAGFRLSVYDFTGAESLQEEARELAQRAPFPPAFVSAGIDLLLIAARRHTPGGVESLLEKTSAAAATMPGFHGWLWQLRLCQVRAELALARRAFATAIAEATDGIVQCRRRVRPKYEALGLITRARALDGIGRTHDAIADARNAVTVARAMADPALLLAALDALLSLDGDDRSAADAQQQIVRISTALPEETIRQRFFDSEVVSRVQGWT
jgi:tetratricopeptide (TPR) repeat protein